MILLNVVAALFCGLAAVYVYNTYQDTGARLLWWCFWLDVCFCALNVVILLHWAVSP